MRELVVELGMPRGNVRALRETLRDMVRDGALIRLGRGRFLPAAPVRLEQGILKVARKGYGFVHVEGSTDVVFVPRREMSGALHGDAVTVRVTLHKDDGRLEGTVERVRERANRVLLGVWESTPVEDQPSRRGWVRPLDAKVALRIRAANPEPLPSGTVVEITIDQFPDFGTVADGRVAHVIGLVDDPKNDVAIVCRKYGLTDRFPPEVDAELARTSTEVAEADVAGRRDFRDTTVCTIDPETARDFDDAIAVTRRADGGWDVAVHIADVSHYVREGSALDREAARRGTSVYFPGSVIPMLPHPLSSGICSLKPHVDRLVVSALMTLSPQGEPLRTELCRGVIRSSARLTYQEAQRILDGDAETQRRHPMLVTPLACAEELARLLRARRQERGSIDFDLPEAEILWSAEGEMTGIVAADQSFTHKVIEELMLLANQAVATRLHRSRRPTICRVHERPDPARLDALQEELTPLGLRLEGSLLEAEPAMFQRLLARVAGRPEERLVSNLVLRAMMQARYDTSPLGHFGLAMPFYTHFTSPIRRYPDLVIHRLLMELEDSSPRPARDLGDISRHSSDRERVSMDAEREVMDIKKARFMQEHLGDELPGMVLSLDRAGLWVELSDYLIDGFVPMGTLTDDVYELLPSRMVVGTMRGRRLRLGDPVRVRVERVDIERRSIDFSIVWPHEAGKGEPPSRHAMRRQRQQAKRLKSSGRPSRRPASGRPAGRARRRRR